MAQVTIHIGGRAHVIACRDGEEDHVRSLAAMLDAHHANADRASAGQSGERTMLFVGLFLADQLNEARKTIAALPPPPPAYPVAQPIAKKDELDLEPAKPKGIDPAVLDGIAERLEALADNLESDTAN
ncbi:cell division protein ZapA [Sphingomonas sp. AX6]|uniref:cell division protein ZapA n=1 Tax=Sphingomonas sp. AX6 TaxID=2653171 RepID=UPI0012EF8BFA|nr:cell division protein ZapA [Sphingomonas sp. AX6]VXC93748.1 Cell division protein ZapA [Sphingomonas sp. AX6]